MVRRGGSETTARNELKSGWPTAESDGGIGGGKYCCHRPLSSVVNDVFDCGGAQSSSDRGRLRRGLVVSLPPSSLCGDGPLDPDGDDDEDNDDRSRQDRATGMWSLCRGTLTITMTNYVEYD